MEAIIEELPQDPWEDLPQEIACEIISHVTELQQIIKYMQISRRFEQLAKQCIQWIDSSEYVEIPVSWLIQFQMLIGTGALVRIVLDQQSIPLLSQLPHLIEANFITTLIPLNYLFDETMKLLRVLNLSEKLSRAKFRMVSELELRRTAGLIIQNNHLYSFGTFEYGSVLQKIFDTYPTLKYINRKLGPHIYTHLVSNIFKNFVEQAEFGLVDPSRPPGLNNPSISPIVRRLIQSGTIDKFYISMIIVLYIRYHRLGSVDLSHIHSDQLIMKYLGNLDIFERLTPLDSNYIGNELISSNHQTIHQFDVPRPLPLTEYQMTINEILNTNNIYRRLKSFYLEDGSVVSCQ